MVNRFAPSPTGDLHLGNARTALLAWLQTRSMGGTFILRMEDLDPTRVRPEYVTTQMADLRWLGLDWDYGPDVGGPSGPYIQSQRTDSYLTALRDLTERGLVYNCYCSRKEIVAAASAPHGPSDEGPPYPGTCAHLTGARDGAPLAVRFRVSPEPVVVKDEIQGERTFAPARETGDFVVWRKDGVAAYQLAVVVDDAAMGVTHVLRGADLLPSTARQILLYRALGLEPPVWSHVPLILGPDGERLSKRHGAPSLRELREEGEPPERVVGWLAASCGLARPGLETTPAQLISAFDPDRIPVADQIVDLSLWASRKASPSGSP